MPDAPIAPNPSAPPVTTNEPAKFAGKYADDAAALKGVSEIRKQVGLDELAADKPLYGENGHFRDRAHAESQYKEYERIYHATRAKPAAAPVQDLGIKNDPAPEADEPPDVVLQKAGITREEAAKALQTGSLTAEQCAKIRASVPTYKNLSDAKINLIAKGHYAEIQQAESKRAEVFGRVSETLGGEDKHNSLREWAKQNVPQEVRDEWSKIVEKSPAMYEDMMRSMAARHAEAIRSGKSAPLITGTSSGGGSGLPATLKEANAFIAAAHNDPGKAAIVRSPAFQQHFKSLTGGL